MSAKEDRAVLKSVVDVCLARLHASRVEDRFTGDHIHLTRGAT